MNAYAILQQRLKRGKHTYDNAKNDIAYLVADGLITSDQAEELKGFAKDYEAKDAISERLEQQEEVNALVFNNIESMKEYNRLAKKAIQNIASTAYSDEELLESAVLFDSWESGKEYKKGEVILYNGKIFRVVQDHKSQSHQEPGSEGMFAIYSPITTIDSDAGTKIKPIEFVNGMKVENGLYYSFEGKIYLAKTGMNPCIWNPGTQGLWQWELVK